jgi:hypothetical protein
MAAVGAAGWSSERRCAPAGTAGPERRGRPSPVHAPGRPTRKAGPQLGVNRSGGSWRVRPEPRTRQAARHWHASPFAHPNPRDRERPA